MRPVNRILVTTAFVLTAGAAIASPSQARPQALLISGLGNQANPPHPFGDWRHEFYNDRIAQILAPIVDVTVTQDLSTLNDTTLMKRDLILNNSLFLEPTPAQWEAFYRFVERGGAYFVLHTGLVSFLNSARYASLLGARFVGHDALKTFRVEPTDAWFGADYAGRPIHPITRGVAAFTIQDELYVVDSNTADLEVLARAEYHPILWLRRAGAAKILCLTLGHSPASLENSGYQQLLSNGVRWLVGYPFFDSIPSAVFPVSSQPVDYVSLRLWSHHPNQSALTYSVAHNTNPRLLKASIDRESRVGLRFVPGLTGSATLTLKAADSSGHTAFSELKLTVSERGTGNLSRFYGTTALTSSDEGTLSASDPRHVLDGSYDTRWSSAHLDPSWIQIDLHSAYPVGRVKLVWEEAYARKYLIQVSNDAQRWTTVHTENKGDGGADEIAFQPVKARYVRMYGTERATPWGYSLYEFEIYGPDASR